MPFALVVEVVQDILKRRLSDALDKHWRKVAAAVAVETMGCQGPYSSRGTWIRVLGHAAEAQ